MQRLLVDQLVGKNLGDYCVERLLENGRLSAVYLAHDLIQHNPVALTTFILPEQVAKGAHTRFMQRFTQEATTLTDLKHPHLLAVHGCGEQFGYPYLVTPYMMNGSLADVLKEQGQCTPLYISQMLEQVASGLDYAHSKGIIHGTLKSSNILLSNEQTMLIAGFGLMNILQMHGIEQRAQPYAHLLSVAETFLYAPEYIAPEIVQGQPVDARSDIYALGIILFELLSGKPPFTGTSPIDVAMQHVQQPLPMLRSICSDLPIAIEVVVNTALARNPDQRFQHAGELAEAFSQVCTGVTNHSLPQVNGKKIASELSTHTVANRTTSWQIMPPIVTGRLPAVQRPIEESPETAQLAFTTSDAPLEISTHDALSFVEDSRTSVLDDTRLQTPEQPVHVAPPPPVRPLRSVARYAPNISRRQVVAILAAGSVAVTGVFVALKTNLGQVVGTVLHPSPPLQGKQQSSPIAQRHNVVGTTKLPLNSSSPFTNPADGKESLLMHLPNGKFFACERACPHAGVLVNYDPATHTLICPAHGAIFDPSRGAKVLQGPANKPLTSVTVHVNTDGTITTE